MTPKKFGLKYVQKLTKRTTTPYIAPSEVCAFFFFLKFPRHFIISIFGLTCLVPCQWANLDYNQSRKVLRFFIVVYIQLGVLLNSLKRMLDVLRPKIEIQLKSWGSCCIPDQGNVAAGERLSEVTVMLRSKFRNYLQAVVEKLVENVSALLFMFFISFISVIITYY